MHTWVEFAGSVGLFGPSEEDVLMRSAVRPGLNKIRLRGGGAASGVFSCIYYNV